MCGFRLCLRGPSWRKNILTPRIRYILSPPLFSTFPEIGRLLDLRSDIQLNLTVRRPIWPNRTSHTSDLKLEVWRRSISKKVGKRIGKGMAIIRGNSAMVRPLWRAAGCGDKASPLSAPPGILWVFATLYVTPTAPAVVPPTGWRRPIGCLVSSCRIFSAKEPQVTGLFCGKAWLFCGNWPCNFRPNKEVLLRKMTCKLRPQKRATDCRALLRELTLQLHAKERGSFAGNGP